MRSIPRQLFRVASLLLEGVIAATLLVTSTLAQVPSSQLVARARPLDTPIVVDGQLDEWTGRPFEIRIDHRDQVWRGIDGNRESHWSGPEDASLELTFAFDSVSLYIAGRVRDDDLVYNESRWWQGDAIELFIDSNRRPGENDSPDVIDLDDAQVFLMPWQSKGRRWGVVSANGTQSDGQFDGVQVAARQIDDQTYEFEASFAWVNFYGVRLEDGVIGFHVALDDFDRADGPDTTYLSWNGEGLLYERVAERGRLELLEATSVLDEATRSRRRTSWWQTLLGIVLRVVAALTMIAALFFVVPSLYRVFQVRRRWRTRTLWIVVGTLATCALCTTGLIAALGFGARDQLEDVGETVRRLESEGWVEVFLGGIGDTNERSRRLLDVLSGKEVELPPEFGFELVDLSTPKERSSQVSEGLPLRTGEVSVFEVHPRSPADRIDLLLSVRLSTEAASRSESAWVARAGRLLVEFLDGSRLELPTAGRFGLRRSRPPFDEAIARAAGLSVERELPDGATVDRLSLRLPDSHRDREIARLTVQIQSGAVRAELFGIECIRLDADGGITSSVPVSLGSVGRTGIPAAVREGWPRDTGPVINDQHRSFELPLNRPAAGRAWLILAARKLDELHSLSSQPVATVTFRYAEDVTETTVPLHRGRHLIEPDREPGRPYRATESPVAYEWRDEGGWHHYGIVEIPLTMAPLASFRFELAPGITRPEIRLVALTLGRPQPQRFLPDSEMVLTEGNRARLQAGVLADPDAIRFSIFLGNRLVRSTFDEALQGELEGTLPADEETFAGDAGQATRLRQLGTRSYFESIVRVTGHNDVDRAIGLYVAAEPSLWLVRLRNWAGVGLLLLTVPFVILRLSDALSRLRRLRAKLLAAFTLTSLVPVLVSFVVLANLLESNHRKELMAQTKLALEGLRTNLSQREQAVQELAKSCFEIIDNELWTPGLEVSVFDALPPRDMQELLQQALRDALGPDAPLPIVAVEENRGLMRREIFFAEPGQPAPSPLFEAAEPGMYRRWGRSFLFGTHQEGGELLRVAIALPIDGAELARLLPDGGEALPQGLLYSVRGFLTADSAADGERSLLAPVSREVRHAIGEIARKGGPALRLDLEGEAVLAYDLIQRDDGEAVGVLAARLPLVPMRLGLLVAEVAVRDFFLVAGFFAVLVAVTVATVITDRLTRPLLRLEKGAREVSRGNYAIRVREEAADEIGQLARTFNFMTASLDDRLRDLSSLHQGMKDLVRHFDHEAIIQIAVDFFVERLDPTRLQVALIHQHGEPAQVFDWSRRQSLQTKTWEGNEEALLTLIRETSEVVVVDEASALQALREKMGKQRRWMQRLVRVIVLPLPLKAPTHGLVLIGFDEVNAEHAPDPNFLATMASQVAVALENARLYRLAIIDQRTGLYTHAYFESRLAEELDRAAENARPLSVMKIAIDDAAKLERELGAARWRSLVLEVLTVLRDTMRRLHLMATSGRGEYEVVLPETPPAAANALCRAVVAAVRSQVKRAGGGALAISAGTASYPEDGESKEFLLSSVDQRLIANQRSEFPDSDRIDDKASDRLASRQDRLRRLGAVFESPKMIEIFETCERISASNITVLIEGETGVGKEVLAELIHSLGDRALKPIVRVNCSAFPETLLETELFGHERGAFTGAIESRMGRFEMADGGTIFLDEIGEISPATQVKLLRVLQERKFERLGGNDTVEVDVRVIAATNRDLVEAIQSGDFREDLYYRLRVVSMVVPPLRERREEIPALVRLFRELFNRENPKKPVRSISPRAMDRLFHHDWPGNIRELKNVVHRAMVLVEGDVVQPEHLSLEPGPRVGSHRRSESSSERSAAVDRARSSQFRRDVSGLSARQARLLEYLEVAGRITNREYIEQEGISERTGLRDITDLVRRHYLEKRGRRKGAYYVIAGADTEVGRD